MLFLEDGRVHNELLHAEPENFFLRVPRVPEVRLAAFGIGICHVVKIKSDRSLLVPLTANLRSFEHAKPTRRSVKSSESNFDPTS